MEFIEQLQKSPWEMIPRLSTTNLEHIIKIAADSYYDDGISLINDEIYDALLERLSEIKPASSLLQNIGATPKGRKVKLPYWMGSMDKIKTDNKALTRWLNKYDGPYVVSDKLDGISCLLVMKRGVSTLYTRGDGIYGQNITHLFTIINTGCQYLIKHNKTVVLRGELIISKKKFKQHSDIMANARNMVGGIVNTLKLDSINKKHAADIDLVMYEIIEPKMIASEQLVTLNKWKTNTVNYHVYSVVDIDMLKDKLVEYKHNTQYEIDGIVVTDNGEHQRVSGKNPSHSFAYKGINESKVTKVKDVIWTASKDGILVPRIRYTKVKLGQADLEFTSGFNARYIYENGIGPGSIIKVTRSGDTIPHIIGIVKKVEPYFPQVVEYEWDANGVNIVVEDIDNNEVVIIKRITKFLRDIGVENISEGLVTKIVQNGYDDIFMVINMTEDDFLAMEGFQKRLSTKISTNLSDALEKIDLVTLMKASNIFGRGLGKKKIERVLYVYPNIVTEYNKTKRSMWLKRLIAIDGYENVTAQHFLNQLPTFIKFYVRFTKYYDVANIQRTELESDKFAGEVVVFSGFRNLSWENYIKNNGGRIATSVSKNTTMLVYKSDDVTAKYRRAIDLGIELITVNEFADKYQLKNDGKK
jgi:NAD-dependent DNA ligase